MVLNMKQKEYKYINLINAYLKKKTKSRGKQTKSANGTLIWIHHSMH